ncbi:MAG: HEAT repeat domain-containing protein, partial [Candidatus Omnitrophota bacterium]
MSRNRTFIKIVATVVAVIFLHQQVVWAAGDMAGIGRAVASQSQIPYADAYRNINLPEELAQTDDIHINGSEDLIINIQDCHSSLSAQYSIVKILNELLHNYDLNVVAIEGGSGYIDTSILKSLPDEKIKEKTAAYLMKEGKISAGEFFTSTTSEDIALYGAENNALYQENLKVFRQIHKKNRGNISVIKVVLDKLREAESKIYSSDLSRMVYKARLHRQSKISFDIYWDFLEKVCAKEGIDTSGYKNIRNFTDSVELESQINFDEATAERKVLIDILMKNTNKESLEEMVIKSLAYEKGQMEQAEYHKWLLEFAARKGLETGGYEELLKFTDYASGYHDLNVIGLQNELDAVEKEVLEELFSSDREKELYELVRTTELLKGLFEVKLSGEDVTALSTHVDKITSKNYKRFIKKVKGEENDTLFEALEGLEGMLLEAKDALKFYSLAEKRNDAMMANTVAAMRREGKHIAALVSGGHHSTGLTDLMKSKGLSYLVLMPKFFNDQSRPYVAILTKKTGPYEELVSSGEYDLALEAYFDTGDLNELEELLAYAVGQNALQGKDVDEEITKWVTSYKEAYETLSQVRREAMDEEPVNPQELEERLSRIKVTGKDAGSCEVTVDGNKYKVTAEEVEILETRAKRSGVNITKHPANVLRILQNALDEFKIKPRHLPNYKVFETVSRVAGKQKVFPNMVPGLNAEHGTGLNSVLGGLALAWAANSVKKEEAKDEEGPSDRGSSLGGIKTFLLALFLTAIIGCGQSEGRTVIHDGSVWEDLFSYFTDTPMGIPTIIIFGAAAGFIIYLTTLLLWSILFPISWNIRKLRVNSGIRNESIRDLYEGPLKKAKKYLFSRGEEALPALINAFATKSHGPLSFHQQIENVLRYMDVPLTPHLVKGLAHKKGNVRKKCAELLGKRRDAVAVEALIPLLLDPEVEVRNAAATALGEIRDRRAVPALINVLEKDELVARNAAGSLGQLNDLRALAPLMKAAMCADTMTRVTAIM